MLKKLLITFTLTHASIYATPDTVTLELTNVDRAIYNDAKGLAITCNVGGSGDKLFLFDTGSSGLFSGVVGNATDLGTSFLQSYESGIHFCGTAFQGSIDFGGGASTSDGVFGGISCAQGSIYSCTCTTSPCTSASCFPTPDSPPLYGTFGASLIQSKIIPEIYTMIAQLPGNLSTGFIVQTGGFNGDSPTLIIGLTDENRQGFISAKLAADGQYPNGVDAWDDRSLKAATSVSFEGENQNIQEGTILFDTGNPDAHISPNDPVNPAFLSQSGDRLETGVLFDAAVNDAVNWSFLAGTTVSEDRLGVTAPIPNKTYMTTGIDIFYRYNVMYDIKNGRIGFQPISQVDVSSCPNNTIISTPITNIGSIPTSLVQTGPNNIFLTADNTYSNGTIISGGQISIYRDSNLGNSSGGVTLNGGTLRIEDDYSTARSFAIFSGGGTFDTQTFSATLTGPFNGKGKFTIAGNGITTFASTLGSFFQGIVEVQGGTFIANGSLESGTVQVDIGGTLKGVGPIGTIINDGIVHPGNSPGTMNVAQNYSQSSTGTLEIDILNTAAFSQLIAGGTASLNGALDVTLLPNSFITPGDSFQIIQAAGGVSGTFSDIALSLPSLFRIFYNPNNVTISVLPLVFLNLSPNALAAAECFVDMAGADALFVTDALLALNANQINSAFNQMQPSQFSAVTWTQLENALLIRSSYSQRLNNLYRKCCGQWNFWANGLGQWQHQKTKHHNQFGYNDITGGLTLGTDAYYNDFRIGAAASYTYSDLHWKESAGDALINSYYGGLYESWNDGCNYINACVLGAYSRYRTSRHLHFGTIDRRAKTDHNSWEALASLETGVILQESFCDIDLIPFASIDYVYLSQQGYSERGADSLNLNVRRRNDQLIQSQLGIVFTYCTLWECSCKSWIVDPRLSLSYTNQSPLTGNSYRANFVDSNCEFSAKGWDFQRNLGVAAFSLNFSDCAETMAITLNYDGQFSKNYWNQTGNIMVNFYF